MLKAMSVSRATESQTRSKLQQAVSSQNENTTCVQYMHHSCVISHSMPSFSACSFFTAPLTPASSPAQIASPTPNPIPIPHTSVLA